MIDYLQIELFIWKSSGKKNNFAIYIAEEQYIAINLAHTQK